MKTEKDIENYLVDEAKKIGALVRKCQWVGHNHCPDRVIMTPWSTVWVEVKAPNQKPRAGQLREHERMRDAGQSVWVVDSIGKVNHLLMVLRIERTAWQDARNAPNNKD